MEEERNEKAIKQYLKKTKGRRKEKIRGIKK
jgi:hypothetical protein